MKRFRPDLRALSACAALVAVAAFSAPAAAQTAEPVTERLWRASGGLHPLVVHFPIALLVVAIFFEFGRLRRGAYKPSPAGMACLLLGTASAIVAAVMGWSSAESAGYGGASAWMLGVHRWAGVATAGLGVMACVAAAVARIGNDPRLLNGCRVAMVFTVIAVAVAGHFGGSLVHGETVIQDAISIAMGRDGTTDQGADQQVASTTASGGAEGPAADARVVNVDDRSGKGGVSYAKDIEPIFMTRCYKCHSGEEPEGGIDLSTRESLVAGGESGKPGIVPGDVAASYLYALVSGENPKKRMPPKGSPLTGDQLASLRAWIENGAEWTETHQPGEHWHWAYRPPVRVNPPAVRDTSWPRNTIDHFVLEKIEAAGLTPSPEADRATLIRRLSLDLIGLVPSVEEVSAFVNDTRPGAYDRVVDRLLASPHFGERWARVWLDLARYADSHGYEKDGLRVMWPYRDWVIAALNDDMPFDEFTIEQLGGDLLENPTGPQLVATGFHRNTQTNEEGGTDVEEFRVDAVIDRLNTTGTVWLGSTVGCAQCHDHKNDPLTQKDYFRLLAIFNQDAIDVRVVNSLEKYAAGAMIDYPRDGKFQELAALNDALARAEKLAATRTPALEAEQRAWEARWAAAMSSWSVVTPVAATAESGATMTAQTDGSLLVGGNAAEHDTYQIELDVPAGTRAVRLETLGDAAFTGGGPGRAPNANFVLTDFSLWALPPRGEPGRIAIASARADYEQETGERFPASAAIDGDEKSGWAIGGQNHGPHAIVFTLDQPMESATRVRAVLKQRYGGHHCIGRPRVSVSALPDAAETVSLPPALAAAIISGADRTAEQDSLLWERFRQESPALEPARRELADLSARRSQLIAAQALVMRQNDTPRQQHVFVRGSFLSPGDPVDPGTPSFLPPMPEGVAVNRLTFARWLVSPENPLTGRVTVNRLWETLFSRGIVETSEDFGPSGDPPTHPELLDWLATEFVRDGWSIKRILREIVTSATYRQSSRVTPDHLAKDPMNKLMARAPRFRAEAEMIRDIGLSASGMLTPTIGGPSVFPPQPDGTWTQIYSGYQWTESKGPDRYRRGLYTFLRRTSPYPAFATFDAPSREITCTRRPRTSTPLQALTTLNDPAFVEMAAGLARRMMTDGGSTVESRARYGMRLCVSREPTQREIDRLTALYHEQFNEYSQQGQSAADLAAMGAPGTGGTFDPVEVSAWTVVANVLLNLDETLSRN
ncbi:MAG: hypothetical protein AMXMBFR58_25940 [Phycisphaerae bacterium]